MGVPCARNAKGELAPSTHLAWEVGQNIHFWGVLILDGPTWFRAAVDDPTITTSGVSLVIYDQHETKAKQLTKQPTFMYAQRVNVRITVNSRPYKQCARCHWLTHTVEQCTRPADFKRCGHCGEVGHLTREHQAMHCRGAHSTITCPCPHKCFNCTRAGKQSAGHSAIDDNCPLKKHLRRDSPTHPPFFATKYPHATETAAHPTA